VEARNIFIDVPCGVQSDGKMMDVDAQDGGMSHAMSSAVRNHAVE